MSSSVPRLGRATLSYEDPSQAYMSFEFTQNNISCLAFRAEHVTLLFSEASSTEGTGVGLRSRRDLGGNMSSRANVNVSAHNHVSSLEVLNVSSMPNGPRSMRVVHCNRSRIVVEVSPLLVSRVHDQQTLGFELSGVSVKPATISEGTVPGGIVAFWAFDGSDASPCGIAETP